MLHVLLTLLISVELSQYMYYAGVRGLCNVYGGDVDNIMIIDRLLSFDDRRVAAEFTSQVTCVCLGVIYRYIGQTLYIGIYVYFKRNDKLLLYTVLHGDHCHQYSFA